MQKLEQWSGDMCRTTEGRAAGLRVDATDASALELQVEIVDVAEIGGARQLLCQHSYTSHTHKSKSDATGRATVSACRRVG